MLSGSTINDLLDYTDWERQQWLDWLRQQDQQVLEISSGPSVDGRFEKIGDLVRHIFSAEKRYVEKLTGRCLTDTATIPANNLELLFEFGRQSRQELKGFIEALPAEDDDKPQEFKLMNSTLTASPRKIVTHVSMHEIRHWAQIATLCRLNGLQVDMHDFLFSPVMGELKREQHTA